MDHQKEKLMTFIRTLPAEIYHRQPDIHTWSILQVANHLYLSERYSLAYLKKKLSYPDAIPPFSFKSWWSTFVVVSSLWLPIRIKAPKNIDMRSDQPVLEPSELETEWNQVRAELALLISKYLPHIKSHLVFRHPFSGRMTIRQMLIFFNHHIAHHLRQVKKIKKRIDSQP